LGYEVLLASAAVRDWKRLPPQVKPRLREALGSLAEDPRARSEKLAGAASYRHRVGDYRIVFRVDERAREVLVTRIKHRREAYRR